MKNLERKMNEFLDKCDEVFMDDNGIVTKIGDAILVLSVLYFGYGLLAYLL